MTMYVVADQTGDVYAIVPLFTQAALTQIEVEARIHDAVAERTVPAEAADHWLPLIVEPVSDEAAEELRRRVTPILEMEPV